MNKRVFNKSMIIKYIFLSVCAFISLFPFFWMVIGATNKSVDVVSGKLTLGSNLMTNLNSLLSSDLGFINSIVNSLIIAVITTVLALIVSSIAGYGFEIFRTPARDRVFSVLLLSMMVPFSALMIPLYKFFASMNGTFMGLNSYTAIILPSISTAFLIFFFRQNTKSFPKDILEAARIDGLGELAIFFKMYVPTMKNTYAAGAIITFMTSWNNYLWPLLVLQTPEKRTVPLVISTFASSYTPDYGMIMLSIVIATLPTAIVFFTMQKHFVAGMIGAVK